MHTHSEIPNGKLTVVQQADLHLQTQAGVSKTLDSSWTHSLVQETHPSAAETWQKQGLSEEQLIRQPHFKEGLNFNAPHIRRSEAARDKQQQDVKKNIQNNNMILKLKETLCITQTVSVHQRELFQIRPCVLKISWLTVFRMSQMIVAL